MIPTIEQVMKCYRVVAQSERMKTGRPDAVSVENTLRGTRMVCVAAGIDLTSPVSALTRQAFDTALSAFVDRGLTRLTAWSYVCQLRALFARWCRPYYKDVGWEIPSLEVPVFRAQAPRYVRPCAELLARVKAWYAKLTGDQWFAATMMLEFAMRNGDVLRLKKENFVTKFENADRFRDTQNFADCDVAMTARNPAPTPQSQSAKVRPEGKDANPAKTNRGVADAQRQRRSHIGLCQTSAFGEADCVQKKGVRHYLSYTPHKTALSSGRRVYWPIHDAIWQKFEDYGGLDGFDVTDETFDEINRDLRSLGFYGQKGAYELRKICIDHIYQKYGAEMAVSISGDSIGTISRYYADPSQPNIGSVRVIDLL